VRSNGLTARLMVGGDEVASSDQWSLTSIPLPRDDARIDLHRHILEYAPNPWHGLPVEPDLSVCLPRGRRTPDAIWVRIVSDGAIVGAIDGPLVEWRSTADRLVVVIDGDAVDELMLGLYLVLDRQVVTVDWRTFRDENVRRAWLLACAHRYFRSDPTSRASAGRGEHIDVRLTTDDFEDESSLFCYLGEAILGYGGYVGQNLAGLYEVIGAIVHEEITITVRIVDPEAIRAAMSEFLAHDPHELEDPDGADVDEPEDGDRGDYFDGFFEVLRDRGVTVDFVEP